MLNKLRDTNGDSAALHLRRSVQSLGSKAFRGLIKGKIMKWEEYEEAVRDIQLKFGNNCTVERDVKIRDDLGINRQFDVVCRAQVQHINVLYVTECKHRTRPIDMAQVEGFNQKATSVNANIKSIFSSKGFRKNALAVAKKYGINCYSICDNGLTVDNEKVFGWHNFAKSVVVTLLEGRYETAGPSKGSEAETGDESGFKVGGIDLIWFLRSCVDKQLDLVASLVKPDEVFKENVYLVSVKPKTGSKYFMVKIGSETKRCRLIRYKVKIHSVVKMKFKPLESRAVYDHHEGSVSLPKGEGIAGVTIDTRNIGKIFEDWDDATLDVLKKEKLLIFYVTKPPVPKGFKSSRYKIHVRAVPNKASNRTP